MILVSDSKSPMAPFSCAAVAFPSETVFRDSADPGGGMLTFSRSEWGSFLAMIRAGRPSIWEGCAGECGPGAAGWPQHEGHRRH
jgi:hypothetical protein